MSKFSDEEACLSFLKEKKWPNGYVCPKCGATEAYYLKTTKRYQCKHGRISEPFSEQGKRYRARKAVQRDLLLHRNMPDEQAYLWKTVIAFENYLFTTSGRGSNPGVRFKYEVSKEGKAGGRHYRGDSVDGYGNEMWIIIDGVKREKSISRSTVDLAYKKAQELMKTDGYVSGPKKLGIPGAGSYLYAMLLSWGIISREATNFSSNV